VKSFSFKSIYSDNTRNAVTRIRLSGKAVIAPCAALLIAAGALAASGCSKSKNNQSANLSSQSQIALVQSSALAATPSQAAIAVSQPEVPKNNSVKGPVKRLTVRRYKDDDSGVSFAYPRKAMLEVSDKAQQDSVSRDRLPMSYVGPGGRTLAVVQLPANKELSGDLLLLNINKQLTAEACNQFPAESDARGELSSSEASSSQTPTFTQGSKVLVGGVEYSVLEKGSDNASIRYYHRFVPAAVGDQGICYEFSMFVNSESQQDLKTAFTADRKDVFAKLEKILASMKITPQEKTEMNEAARTDSTTKDAVSEPAMETAKAVTKQDSPR